VSDSNERTSRSSLRSLFSGKKAKWLPLFQRLVARFSYIPGVELAVYRKSIALGCNGDAKPTIGMIQITARGLQVGLGLHKAALKSPRLKLAKRPKSVTHKVLISKASEIDDELLSWIKAARHQARTAKRRST